MTKTRLAHFTLLALAIAGCQRSQDDNIAIDDTTNVATEIETLPPDETVANGEMTNEAAGNAVEPPTTLLIPSAFRGRWGMVPGDCTSTLGDAKGLITIDGDSIKFYESKATLTKVTANFPENFTGNFAFTGEGQNWTKSQNLKLTGSSNTLIRGETEPAASFTYKRCS